MARAIIKDAPIVIFDEATSNFLDIKFDGIEAGKKLRPIGYENTIVFTSNFVNRTIEGAALPTGSLSLQQNGPSISEAL